MVYYSLQATLKVFQALESVGKILRCDFSNKFFLTVLFIVLTSWPQPFMQRLDYIPQVRLVTFNLRQYFRSFWLEFQPFCAPTFVRETIKPDSRNVCFQCLGLIWIDYNGSKVPLKTWMTFALSRNQAKPSKQDACTNLVSTIIVRQPLPVGCSLDTSVLTKTSPFS